MAGKKRNGDADRGAAARRLGEAMHRKIEALETVEKHAAAYRAHAQEPDRLREHSTPKIRRLHRARLLTIRELSEAGGLSVPRINRSSRAALTGRRKWRERPRGLDLETRDGAMFGRHSRG